MERQGKGGRRGKGPERREGEKERERRTLRKRQNDKPLPRLLHSFQERQVEGGGEGGGSALMGFGLVGMRGGRRERERQVG